MRMKHENILSSNKVFRNFSYLTGGNFLSQILAFIVLIRLTEFFPPDTYGIYSFMFIQGQLLMTVNDFGLRNIIIRTIARDEQLISEVVFNGLFIKLIIFLLIAILYSLYNTLLGNLSSFQVLLVVIFSIISSIVNTTETVFYGLQKMKFLAIASIVLNVSYLIIVYLIKFESNQVNFLFTIFISLHLFKLIILVGSLKIIGVLKQITRNLKLSLETIKSLITQSLPYYGLALMNIPIFYLSNNFLILNSTEEQVAYFNLTTKTLAPITMVFTVSFLVIFPDLSSKWEKEKRTFIKQVSIGLPIFIYVASMFVFVVGYYFDEITNVIYSTRYSQIGEIGNVYVWYLFLLGFNSLLGTIWGASNKENLIFKTSVLNFVISTPLIYVTSRYNAFWLAWGYTGSFIIFEIFLFIIFLRSIRLNNKKELSLIWIWPLILLLTNVFLNDISLIFKFIISIIFVVIFFFMVKEKVKVLFFSEEHLSI